MKLFLAAVIIGLVAVLIVAAVVFRSRRASDALKFIEKVFWGYVIAIVILAAIQYWRHGF